MNEDIIEPPHKEPHLTNAAIQQNWLRAAVLGANDGIVSIAALIVGVAGASSTTHSIFLVGTAGLLAGALSMSVGEYVSVSSQRDTEKALLEKERFELENFPEEELEELAGLYQKKGLTRETAELVARELMDNDPFAAHADAELGIDPNELTNPTHAAIASAVSFFIGGVIPLIVILVAPAPVRIPVTFVAVLIALVVTGVVSGHVSGASKTNAVWRVVIGGVIAMAITFGVGRLFGVEGV
ncbi:MAG: VIT family protein [Candidatus Pacebacteria bacterium]|nr:VIT family protein [Candidatus Paceibacterota bacterium]